MKNAVSLASTAKSDGYRASIITKDRGWRLTLMAPSSALSGQHPRCGGLGNAGTLGQGFQ